MADLRSEKKNVKQEILRDHHPAQSGYSGAALGLLSPGAVVQLFAMGQDQLYLKLGRQVDSDRARTVFMELSEEEARHLEQLSTIFEKTL